MKVLYTTLFSFVAFCAITAQQLTPTVIASTGASYQSAEFSLDYTLGETFVTTLSNNTNILTQGFHQPQAGVIVEGCTDILACNYNIEATSDDGSCYFPGDACDDGLAVTINDTVDPNCGCSGEVVPDVEGCTAIEACNFNPDANIEDGSCIFPGEPCDDGNPASVDDTVDPNCGCQGIIVGCTFPAACNYNPDAIIEDASCLFPGEPCDDANASTIFDQINADCVCEGQLQVEGCVAISACNYDENANVDDASCIFPGDNCNDGDATTVNDIIGSDCLCAGTPVSEIDGCTDETACNFDALASIDDGSCFYPGDACSDGNATTVNDSYNANCQCAGEVVVEIEGCTNADACNFNPLATLDDASCFFIGDPCDDGLVETTDDVIVSDCSCEGVIIEVLGCTNNAACNYNAAANADDGSCYFPGDACDDGDAQTINDTYNANCGCSGEVVVEIEGCTNADACNFNPLATLDDASCFFIGDPCDDGLAETTDDVILSDCSCEGVIVEVFGCTSSAACNYDAAANADDGSCYFPGDAYDDGDAQTINDTYNVNCGCSGEVVVEIEGCTNADACNFNPLATLDDASCFFIGDPCDDGLVETLDDVILSDCSCEGVIVEVFGCTSSAACNYDAAATADDGSCYFPGDACDDGNAQTINDTYNANCGCSGEVVVEIEGCTNADACNFNPLATLDDASCFFIGDPCDDGLVETLDDVILSDCSCEGVIVDVFGCTSSTACNYDAAANADDGSCYFPGDACDDGNAQTINDTYNANCGCSGEVVVDIEGCTNADACNFNPLATLDDASCFFIGDPCDDGLVETTEDIILSDCSCAGIIIDIEGCTNLSACNFNPNAFADDGSCYFPGDNCDDGDVFTINDVYNANCECAGEVVEVIEGCTAPDACNYNISANVEDGSCIFPGDVCDDNDSTTGEDVIGSDCSCSGSLLGCTFPDAVNYNPAAIIDDGSCEFNIFGCTDPEAANYDANANIDDGSCVYGVFGCTDASACNYNAEATLEDDSCLFPGDACDDGNASTQQDAYGVDCACEGLLAGCTVPVASNYNPNAVIDDGSCEFDNEGCTDPEALNFDPAALVDDGSCIYPLEGCTDASACNFNPDANIENGTCTYPGCTDLAACNYDATAACPDNSCEYPTESYLDCSGNCLNDINNNGVCDELDPQGCTDETALNYDPIAVFDNGTCVFEVLGCTDSDACNFSASANTDDGSCTFPGCNDPEACNYDPAAGCYDGNCDYPFNNYDCNGNCLNDSNSNGICDEYEEYGCTDENAINYNGDATSDDGSCIYDGCTDVTACNYDDSADVDDGSCTYPGCTDAEACNYNADAGCQEVGSCTYPSETYLDCNGDCISDGNGNGICDELDSEGCLDPLADNYNPNATVEDGSCLYLGCTDVTACNFDPTALDDDGTCTYPGCTDVNACNFNAAAGCDDGSCLAAGCVDILACNYDASAACDNGSCTYPGCNDVTACNYNAAAGCLEEGSCTYPEFAYDCNGNCINDGNNNGICDPFDNLGCTDPNADNYNPNAIQEDGSCIYVGCTDAAACNYDATALTDDGSCTYPSETCLDCAGVCIEDTDADGTCDCLEIEGCTNPASVNYNPLATEFDGSCILGCMDVFAINYNAQANEDDGSCIYQVLGCTYPTACNYNPEATTDNNTCTFPGCNDLAACNYDPEAGCLLEGSCEYIDVNNNGQCDLYEITGCTNADACNYNPAATFDDGSCGFDTEETTDVTAGNEYEWNGTTYTESGVYEFTYVSAAGCDSVVILNLTITSVLELNVNALQMWPNPANQEVQVTMNGAAADLIEVFDVTGKHIATYARRTRLDVSNWASGSYMIRVRNAQEVLERRLMVVR
jgi:hypothetical protein